MTRNTALPKTLYGLLFAAAAASGGPDHYEQAPLGEHVHGVASLMLVAEAERLHIHILSPAVNVLGFEHQATTDDEHNAVAAFKATAQNAAVLFGFNGANCQLNRVELQVGDAIEVHYYDYGQDHDHDDHHHDHDEADADSQTDHHHAHDEHDEAAHSEVGLAYEFNCEQLARLQSVDVLLLQQFPGIRQLTAQWLTPNGAGSSSLKPQQYTLILQ